MSNRLLVRRVKFQNLNEDGTPDGEPTFGVVASDSYGKEFVNTYHSFEELNRAIEENGSVFLPELDEEGQFDIINPEAINTQNYYGNDCFRGEGESIVPFEEWDDNHVEERW